MTRRPAALSSFVERHKQPQTKRTKKAGEETLSRLFGVANAAF
ncbi:oxytocin receptor-like [Acetobacter orientalis]|uniref:Oxytocin receptor-like n=1 Tax=Acetobacter orientalis TaxID=146474 RepID=A0A2Z5ZHY9_9PROT|nr:oxytocin receptor-like [Acetobacter orientalis]